tara:strand:+ start:14 stop:142 length:129 start_codon:yes stop_codon:yes gene_type:complete
MISKGQTLTYKQVTMKIRKPLSFRAIENACHRVIRSIGTLRG